MSKFFPNTQRLRALVHLWGEPTVKLADVFADFMDEDAEQEYNNITKPSERSTFLTQQIDKAVQQKPDTDGWMTTVEEGLRHLANAAGVSTEATDIRQALIGTPREFWEFVANHSQYNPQHRPAAETASDPDIVSDFKLMGANKSQLKQYLGVIRENVFEISNADIERVREEFSPNGEREPVIRRCAYLYRLGLENMGGSGAVELNGYTHKYSFVKKGFGLVIRRVPCCFIFSANDPYRVQYEEHYEISPEDFASFGKKRTTRDLITAEAYGYAYDDTLAIVSRDMSKRSKVRPSLTQLDWRKGETDLDGDIIMPGVITMESDLFQSGIKPPTAYRVMVKLLDRDAIWENVKAESYTKLLVDHDDGDEFSLLDRAAWQNEDNQNGLSRAWSDYFDMLHIRENPLDLLVARELRDSVTCL